MKKNLLSILILSLLVVNIVMTAIMLFSVIGTNKKTAAIVTDIAGILNLEMADANGNASSVSMEATESYTLPDLTITTKRAKAIPRTAIVSSVSRSASTKSMKITQNTAAKRWPDMRIMSRAK